METRFKIGDFVYIKQDIRVYEESKENKSLFASRPVPLMIVTTLVETCYGGTQVHYRIRGYTKGNAATFMDFTEIELTNSYPNEANEA